jgi:hypothetical protein
MPLIRAAKSLAELCDDFSGIGVAARPRGVVEVGVA